ncbi:MAG: flagellar hook-basal body complex protein [Butyrivibrio sp.]|nr:flagellar hook-basal body complex protein [Butyrivibrio sp.]
MMRSLFSGVAGLKTHQVKMDVIGNNIANVNTTSFKSQSITFSDLMYQTTQRASRATERTGGVNARQIGLGSKSGAIGTAISTQGATETTNNPFDMRITGDAFYIVNNGNQTLYTRDGSFYVDGAGNLAMQSTGYFVYGWTATEDPETGEISVNTNGGIGKLQIMSAANMTYPPEGTTEGVVSGNIDANDINITSDAGKTVTLEFYDNLGYLYTAKFAVRDVDDIEHTYTMTLEDILDSKGNTIGAQKLREVSFTDNPDGNQERVDNIRKVYNKTTVKPKYTLAGYSTTKVSFKDANGQAAYSGVPTSGTIESLLNNEKTAAFLNDVYGVTATTGYYEVNDDGTITVYTVNENSDQGANIGTSGTDILSNVYVASTSADKIVYKLKGADGKYTSVSIDIPTVVTENNYNNISENKKAVLKDLFGINLDDRETFKFDESTAGETIKNTYTISLSSTGMSVNVIKNQTSTTTDTKTYDSANYTIAGTDSKKSTITFDSGEGAVTVPLSQSGVKSLPAELKTVYGLVESQYPTLTGANDYYDYSINSSNGALVITTVIEKDTAMTPGGRSYVSGHEFVSEDGTNATYNDGAGGTVAIPLTGTFDPTASTDIISTFGINPATYPTSTATDIYVYSYTIDAATGYISITQSKTSTTTSNAQLNRTVYKDVEYDTAANTLKVNSGSGYKIIDLKGTFTSTDSILQYYSLDPADYPAVSPDGRTKYTYNYTIDANDPNATMTITTVALTVDDPEQTVTDKQYTATIDSGKVLYKTVGSGAAVGTSIELEGTLTTAVKTVLSQVFGYQAQGDNITYKISADGSQLTIYDKGGGDISDIASTTEVTAMNFTAKVDDSTATYTNTTTGKVVYDSIPRTGYVADIMDATATSTFFEDVYNYTTDNTAADYENLTYAILDDGSLVTRYNYITLKYNAKTGDIEYPTGKIVLNFNQDAIIDNQPKMAGFTDVNLDFSSTTNYNTQATSTIGAVKGDLQSLKTGRSVGNMNGITIGKDGTIYATYSNGQTKLLGQIATAEFANASGLEKQGDNLYASTLNSGEATVQDVTMDGGYITTGVLEMSNVDLSSEFTNMITTQRGFQANSRIITVSDTLLEELTNLKR